MLMPRRRKGYVVRHEAGFEWLSAEFMAVSRGDAAADLCLSNARIINVFTLEIVPGNVLVHGGRIAAVVDAGAESSARRTVDVGGALVTPGFIDAHMHVESTMLPPSEFATLATPHGTTGVVLDPHEIANVLGTAGIAALMENARGVPMHCMFALSSCVPSCHLETSGASLGARDLAPLFDDARVVALAEMMNFPGVVSGDAGVLEKVRLGLARRLVDGHAPGLTGRGLQAYAAAGISSDHECTSAAEALEKLRAGLHIFIREGSAARNFAALRPIVTRERLSRLSFCTDDRHPADLRDEGHIDHVVRMAVRAGVDAAWAVAMGSLHTAVHYRVAQRGAIAPGYHADMLVIDDWEELFPRQVYFEGRLVAERGVYLGARVDASSAARGFPRSEVRLPDGFGVDSLRVVAAGGDGVGARIRVIGMDPHQLVTGHLVEDGCVRDGALVSDPARDLLKIAVIERHRGCGNIGVGFVRGFGLRRGAIASTVGHDAHNLAVVGVDDADMVEAARALRACGGGQCAVEGGRVMALLPLPIAGLMSDQPSERVIEMQGRLLEATRGLGCPIHDPFMPLSFMPLPVIPSLKISDLGLVDVDRFEVVPLVVG